MSIKPWPILLLTLIVLVSCAGMDRRVNLQTTLQQQTVRPAVGSRTVHPAFAGNSEVYTLSSSVDLTRRRLQMIRRGSYSQSQGTAGSLHYLGGPVLVQPQNIYILWYGNWSEADKEIVREFVASFSSSPVVTSQRKLAVDTVKKSRFTDESGLNLTLLSAADTADCTKGKGATGMSGPHRRMKTATGLQEGKKAGHMANTPTVLDWIEAIGQYKDIRGRTPTSQYSLGGEASLPSLAPLTDSSMRSLILSHLSNPDKAGNLPLDFDGMYVVLSSREVSQEGFCSSRCGYHSFINVKVNSTQLPSQKGSTNKTKGGSSGTPKAGDGSQVSLPYAWVGNAEAFCPSRCTFPFAPASGMPYSSATVLPPNQGKGGVDSLVAVLAHEIVEMATDPFFTAWNSADAASPLELADVCAGAFGPMAYPGNPGKLLKDEQGRGFNAQGVNGRRFLLPWLWSNSKGQCVF